MAEGLADQWLKNNHIEGWETASAGTFASEGCRISDETIAALRDHGVHFDGRSTPLSKKLVDRATTVLCMTTTHCLDVASIATDPTKVELLNQFGSITDPIGSDQSVYDALAKDMLEIIAKRVSEIIARHKGDKE